MTESIRRIRSAVATLRTEFDPEISNLTWEHAERVDNLYRVLLDAISRDLDVIEAAR